MNNLFIGFILVVFILFLFLVFFWIQNPHYFTCKSLDVEFRKEYFNCSNDVNNSSELVNIKNEMIKYGCSWGYVREC